MPALAGDCRSGLSIPVRDLRVGAVLQQQIQPLAVARERHGVQRGGARLALRVGIGAFF